MIMDSKYQIYKYLDEEKRIVGLTLDEFIPILLVFIIAFLAKLLLVGILVAAAIFSVMRSIKKKRGRCALLSLIYWNSNKSVGKLLFSAFPPSSKRYWI